MGEETKWLKETGTYRKCPHCDTGELAHRVPRHYLVKMIFGNRLRRYKCDNCQRKVYVKSD